MVYKIAYANGAGDGHVIWKLGKDGDFRWVSSDPYPWFSHQHDAKFDYAGVISLFDNGNTRVSQMGGNSRGQVLAIDESNMTITPVINADLGGYSLALGAAQRLSNGNYQLRQRKSQRRADKRGRDDLHRNHHVGNQRCGD